MQEIKNKQLTLTNDYMFKRIFGKKGNEKITGALIESVTGERYEDINLEDTPILERELLENKMGVLDVKVVANKYNNIDIEMQVVKSDYIADRILWYWAKMYSSSIDRGDSYDNAKRAISILIADFCIEKLKDIPEYHTKWNVREEKYSMKILTDKLELHIIDLSKLENMEAKTEREKRLLEWCKFIKNPADVEESVLKENEELRMAKEEYDKIIQDAKERRLAELREKAIMDEIVIRKSGYNEGKEDGKEEGKEEKAKEIVIKMKKKNLDVETISEVTGLSIEEIEKLK